MKLLVADDHTLFRDALVQYIERAKPGVNIAVTKDFYGAYERLKDDHNFDIVVLDLRMPGMDGMDGLKKIREEFPDVKLALMSGIAEEQDVQQAMDIGACGYFPKTLSGKALVQGIQDVIDGNIYVPRDDDTNKIMPAYYGDPIRNTGYTGLSDEQESLSNGDISNGAGHDFGLTPREKEVLGYLARGKSNKEIALDLGLQVVTIKLHVRGICRKLGAQNRTQAALKATQLNIVPTASLNHEPLVTDDLVDDD